MLFDLIVKGFLFGILIFVFVAVLAQWLGARRFYYLPWRKK